MRGLSAAVFPVCFPVCDNANLLHLPQMRLVCTDLNCHKVEQNSHVTRSCLQILDTHGYLNTLINTKGDLYLLVTLLEI